MTIAQAFSAYLTGLGYQNIYIGGAPKEGPDEIFWIVSNGGRPLSSNATGEKRKSYILSLYYRAKSASLVDQTMQELEEAINLGQCTQLSGFDTIDIEATTFATDQDLDDEDRTVGLIQITITTYL